MFWTTVTSQTSSEKSGRTDVQSNRLLCLAQERDSQKGRTRFRVFARVTQLTRRSIILRPCIRSTFMMHGGVSRCSVETIPPCNCPRHQGCSSKDATGALKRVSRQTHSLPLLTHRLAAWPRKASMFPVRSGRRASSHLLPALPVSKTSTTSQSRSAVRKKLKAPLLRHVSPQRHLWVHLPYRW